MPLVSDTPSASAFPAITATVMALLLGMYALFQRYYFSHRRQLARLSRASMSNQFFADINSDSFMRQVRNMKTHEELRRLLEGATGSPMSAEELTRLWDDIRASDLDDETQDMNAWSREHQGEHPTAPQAPKN